MIYSYKYFKIYEISLLRWHRDNLVPLLGWDFYFAAIYNKESTILVHILGGC